jgi:K+-transporting ATPase ATPase B chain
MPYWKPAKEKYGLRGRELAPHYPIFIPFSAQTRMSGVDMDGKEIRKGAPQGDLPVTCERSNRSSEIEQIVERISNSGGTPLLATRSSRVLGAMSPNISPSFLPCSPAFPLLGTLNIMKLRTPESAILSAVIFNALIIIALIPLALRGVRYRPLGAAALLRRNLFIYGLGGVIAPFLGIKLIDVIVGWMHLA